MLVLEPRPRAFDHAVPLAAGRAVAVAVAVAVAGPAGRAVAAELRTRLAPLAVEIVDDVDAHAALGGLIDVRALDAPEDVAGALALAKGSLFVAQRARAALLASAAAGGAFYVVVTSPSRSPVAAAAHGLLKTAALEWPAVKCAVVDVEPGLDTAAVIVEELHAGFTDVEVVRTGAGRFAPAVVERAATSSSSPRRAIAGRPVVVASGGARGVTATTLLALARATPSMALLLLGRTALVDEPAECAGAVDEAALKRAIVEAKKRAGAPLNLAAVGEQARAVLAVREIRAFLKELEAAGAAVMYRAVDVRAPAAVASACNDARAAFGPITAVVHGAGVLADKRIEDKTAEQVDRVMDTKVLGLHALLLATEKDPLDVVALFSSVAGRFGNVGQVDYAMANEALNEMANALQKARPGVVVKSFNWGPWEGGMVTPALKKIFEERGVRVLSHADGARHFVDELGEKDGVVEVVFGGELAPPTAESSSRSESFHVDSRGPFAFLADHAIQGTVVFPVVGALAVMAKTARATSFTDVRVLRGIPLPQFFADGHDVVVTVDADARALTLAVPGEKGPRYAARAAARVEARVEPMAVDASLDGTLDGARIYRDWLFHGPRFQLVDGVDGVGAAGLVARVRGCVDAGWGHELAVDAGALDAALQAALLWARHRTGGAFLPTSIARVTAPAPATCRGPLVCTVRGKSCDDLKAVVDIVLTRADGSVAAALEGVSLHRLPNDAAFAAAPSPTTPTLTAHATSGTT